MPTEFIARVTDMDKIIINNLHIFAYHGVNEDEKVNGQNFYLDIECFADLTSACLSDNLDDTVSYAKIIKTVKRVFPNRKTTSLNARQGARLTRFLMNTIR